MKKTLKEIRMPLNCGISALEKLTPVKNVSAFTLIHAARDNGLNLFVFKVNDLADLPRVQRPAIFHQKDHFVYVNNGEPMPVGEYTGHVIGPAVLGRVIGLSEAKFITGGKNFLTGENKDGVKEGGGALGAILTVVGGIAGTLIGGPGLGAAIGGAIGGAGGNAIVGDNPLIGAATGALGGYGVGMGLGALGVGQVGAGASAAATGGLEGALGPSGNALNPALYTGANATGAGVSGALDTGLNASVASSTAGLGGILSGEGSSLGGAALANGSGLPNLATTPDAFTPTAYSSGNSEGLIGSQGPQGNAFNQIANNASGNSSATAPQTAANDAFSQAQSIATAAPTPTVPAPTSLLNKAGSMVSNAVTSNPIGAAATAAGALGVFGSTPPAYTSPTPGANYDSLSSSLANTPQGQANSTFGLAATTQNTDYVNTSIPDLQKQFTANNQRTLDTINTAYDNQKQQLVHQFAQAGQNTANSSELQTKVDQLEQKRTNDLTLAQQESQDQALGQAIQVKQQALSQGMQAGQWNQTLAMQLASLTGDQQNLQYAIANNDYTSFQQIMGKLMTMGIPQTVSLAK